MSFRRLRANWMTLFVTISSAVDPAGVAREPRGRENGRAGAALRESGAASVAVIGSETFGLVSGTRGRGIRSMTNKTARQPPTSHHKNLRPGDFAGPESWVRLSINACRQ